MRKLLAAPPTNNRGPRFMEKALAAIHQALHPGETVVLQYGASDGRVGLLLSFAEHLEQVVISPLLANYPQCVLKPAAEWESVSPEGETWTTELFVAPELFPIVRHSQFQDLLDGQFADPIDGLLRATMPDDTLQCRIDFVISPATPHRQRIAWHAVRCLDRTFFRRHVHLAHWYATHRTRSCTGILAWLLGLLAAGSEESSRAHVLETSASRAHPEREEDLAAASDKLAGHLFDCWIRLWVTARPEQKAQALERLRVMVAAFGPFSHSRLATFHAAPVCRGAVSRGRQRGSLLSQEELATLWHPPTATVQAEKLETTEFTELEPPGHLPDPQGTPAVPLGRVRFREDLRLFGLALEDRRRHLYIIGKTGMGKTTLLQNMIAADMQAGHGLCLVDPHGDLADSLVGLVPKQLTNDVILFDAGSRQDVVSFNPLACPDPRRIDQVTSGVVSAFKKLYDSWGPRLEDTLRNAVFATIEQDGNLRSVMQLLGERSYREHLVGRIRDDVVRSFWQHEFASWSDNYRTEAVAAIQNKIRPFLTNRRMRAIVTQPGRSLNLRQIMDSGQILIVNLSKGRVGEDNSTLLGAFLVTCLQQAALTRTDMPEETRRDFSLYIDEFQNFTTGSLASILSEARKFRLSLVMAHQYLAQLNDETADAVFGNVGSIITFQVGSDDAEVLAQQLSRHAGQLHPEDITGLPRHTAYARILIDGPSQPPLFAADAAATDLRLRSPAG